jgi:hypothetical protein
VFGGVVDVLGEVLHIHAEEHVERDVPREDIMDRVQDRHPPGLQVGVDNPSCHPVVGVDDEPAAMPGAYGFDDVVDDLALKFRGVEQRVSPVGT